MKIIQHKIIVFFLLVVVVPFSGVSQDASYSELHFEVRRVYPYISLTKAQLAQAKTLSDINPNYKSSWVNTYVSVDILAYNEGALRKFSSENDLLTREQKQLLLKSDSNTEITVVVRYIPENTLEDNDIHDLNFAFTVEPEKEATYPGAQQSLRTYLKVNAMDKIPAGTYVDYDLTLIQFTIGTEGEIVDAHLFGADFKPSKHPEIEALLLETVCNMPHWIPASYADGTKVAQTFVLAVGNMENCNIHLLRL